MTESHSRLSPDELLANLKAEEEQKGRGKLKIFLGYAAGVGKTFAMLEAARQRQKETDVVIAFIETHHRVETEALVNGFEIIPRRQIEYHGITLGEMDLDAVLARRPKLAIVDELAHDNAPGSRHPKRYQDIEELLAAGIDVYTTLNVQHIESGRNVVAQVTNVWVRETVPDTFIDNATEIEIVDLPPDELLKRLQEGKVYVSEQIAPAIDKFFRKGNLTALRELTMRTAARHVDEQSLEYMKTHAIAGPWSVGERLLVCIAKGSSGTRLIRSARRVASQAGVEWVAVLIETTEFIRLTQEQQDQIADSLRLAQRLGAKTATIQSDSVAAGVVEYAKTNNITRIIIAKPQNKPFLRSTYVEQIIRLGGQIDILLVSGGSEKKELFRKPARITFGSWQGYAEGLGLVALATLFGELVRQLFSPTTLVMLYLLCVIATAVWIGLGPAIMVSFISVLVFDLFFVAPVLSFSVSDTQYIFTFLVLLFVGFIASYLTSRVREQTESARRRERQTAALYSLGRDLALSNDLQSYVQAIVKRAKETFERDAVIFLPDTQNKETLKPQLENSDSKIDANELAAATWSFQHQKTVGFGTDTLPGAKARYLPMVTIRGSIGVLSLSAIESGRQLTLEQERLLEAYSDLAALAIESLQMGAEAHNAGVLRDTEKLQAALFNSVSHDLRTPLVSIIGVLSSLQEEGMHLDETAKKNLVQVAREEADRLNHLITNLLDVSRFEAGVIKLSAQPADVQDLVGTALEQLGTRINSRSINTDFPDKLPFVSVDFGLIVQTLVNILDNALKYSPQDAPIDISAAQQSEEINIQIADRGVGIPPQDLLKVFDKFYRVQSPDNVQGTGLGLSICKGIVEAHGGRIAAENRPGGGTIIRLILPVSKSGKKETEKPDA